ncbi:hypothetical protein BKA70DRAFT_1428863 [Coprinopsis sp. MPI-PUGE-AT-0042]|nr:hypothetical protein BKA70DRAFT_1428863 [Coprinopsis sp. MPI-PUGE-AT-0042]
MSLQRKEDLLKSICLRIGPIFEQAQRSNTNHAKNCAALYKLHLEAGDIIVHRQARQLERQLRKRQKTYDCDESMDATRDNPEEGREKQIVPLGEYRFRDAFSDMVMRCLGMEKVDLKVKQDPTPLIKRVSAFVAAYISYIGRKGAEGHEEAREDMMEMRFTQTVVKLLLRGFDTINRNVRFRLVDMVFRMVKELGVLSWDILARLSAKLRKRLLDKDALIRSKAASTLAIFWASDHLNDPEEGEDVKEEMQEAREALLHCLVFDTDPRVRLSVLCNIWFDEDTLPQVLSRMRDTNDAVRKAVFQRLTKDVSSASKDDGRIIRGPCHPTNLGTVHCMEIIRVVFPEIPQVYEEELVSGTKSEPSGAITALLRKDDGLSSFLRDFQIHILDEEDSDLLVGTLFGVFKAHPDICSAIQFSLIEWEVGGTA